MISSIETEIFEQHALEAAILWVARDPASRDEAYDLPSLAHLDERIEAHLDGLRLAGDDGFRACQAALRDAEAGEIFAATLLAVERRDLRAIATILDLAGDTPELARGFVSALGWTSFDHVKAILPGLLDGRCPAALHYLGIAACAAQRQDPGPALGYAFAAPDPRLRARAYRAVGELGRGDLAPELRGAFADADPGCRFWAAWSAAMFGDPEAAHPLFRFAAEGSPFAARACSTAMRRMDPATALSWLHSIAASAPEAALSGAAALGDPALMPWILECMETPATARRAGAALARITGVDLVAEKLHQKAPAGFTAGPTEDANDDVVAMDPDEGLPWPNPVAVAAWWNRRAKDFKRGTRYLLGQSITPEWLGRVLCDGSQPARAAVAEELSIRHPRRPLFEVRAPGFRQERALSSA